MLPQNTFLIRQMEKIESESAFINILCPQLLQFINDSFFDSTVIFNSSPGGGKSTLLKTFSPEILLELKGNYSKETYKDTFRMLSGWGILDDNEVKLASINISCARENYSLIDDLYENGKDVQVFFELTSLRILRRVLTAILKCNQLDEGDLENITFKRTPDEWSTILKQFPNGKALYQWSMEEEEKLCVSIEEMDAQIQTSMAFNNLAVLSLLENGNILLYGNPVKQKILIMFDDIQALSKRQRGILREAIFQLRPNLAVWMTQRLIALTEDELFGDSGRIHREYRFVNIDNEIRSDKNAFNRALKNVADRRVKLTYKDEEFGEKLEKGMSEKTEEKLKGVIQKIKNRIDQLCQNNQNFTNIYNALEEKEFLSLWDEAVNWQVLYILIERQRQKSQMVFPFVSLYTFEEFKKECEKLHGTAEYMIRYNYKLPLYFGVEDLLALSSYNIEQFLDFSGELFEYRIALDYVSRRKKKTLITQQEQHRVITKCANEKWEDILRTFSMGADIQIFIQKIAELGCDNLKKNTASYSSGTFTGIGIKLSEFERALKEEENAEFIKMLKVCISYNLLSAQEIRQGMPPEIYKVFYLNRWICVRFGLPLGYGGWKKMSFSTAMNLLEKIEGTRL